MKKFHRFILFVLLFLSLSPLDVWAHPGRTDGKGGHTDHSTGEYHYHHGYSAHDHYDMDGDGVIDCPYDFEDKTGHDSSDDDNSTGRKNLYRNGNNDVTNSNSKPEEKIDWFSNLLGVITIGVYIFIFFILPVIGSRK